MFGTTRVKFTVDFCVKFWLFVILDHTPPFLFSEKKCIFRLSQISRFLKNGSYGKRD